MCIEFARLHWLGHDAGRAILRYETDDLAADAAEFDYLLPLYEVVPGERSLFLLGRADLLATLEKSEGRQP